MKKITKKEFTTILCKYTSVFAGSVFHWDDEQCKAGMDKVKELSKDVKPRTATLHATYLLFSNGSRLYFDQAGKIEYFRYVNQHGVEFLLQRATRYDDFDNKNYQDYVIYVIMA